MRTDQSSRDSVQSVERAFEILFAFSADRPVLGASEIARLIGLNRTTAHRLLVTLEACGVVRRDPPTQKYTLTARVLQFSNTFLQLSGVRAAAMAPMAALRDATNETAALHIRDGFGRIVLAQVESQRELRRTYPNLGDPIPLHLGAPSKVILAFMAPDEIALYLDQTTLSGTTPFAWPSREALEEELARIGKQGYAVSCQERSLGVVSIAAPIFDRSGAVVASVNVSGPLSLIGEDERRSYAPLVVHAASDISRALGFIGSEPILRDGPTRAREPAALMGVSSTHRLGRP